MAVIKKGDSRERLLSIQEELDEILKDFLEPRQERYGGFNRSMALPVDIFETNDALHVRVELPGVSKDDVNLYITRNMLIIEGVKQSPYPGGERLRFLNLEREFGKFKREIGIPKPVDGRDIQAELTNGILFIRLTKISDRRGKQKRVPIG